MKTSKQNQFWLTAADDFRRFRMGEVSEAELIEKYPEFEVQDAWRVYQGIREAVHIMIPEDCPLSQLAPILRAVHHDYDDVNYIHYDIRIPYQTAWEAFPQWGKFKEICDAQQPVIFDISLHEEPHWRGNLKPCIDIRFCVRQGGCGDSDGFGIEDDVWIVAILNEDGTFLREWYVEGLED